MLREYQKRMRDAMIEHPRKGVFADPGMGKTLTTLSALAQMEGKSLLIAPIRVCETVWEQEAKKWSIPLSFSLVRGTPKARRKALLKDADIYLINPELLGWLFKVPPLPNFRTLVLDESSLFKNPSTQRFKLLRRNLKRFERRYILTGTPCPNSLMDLWSQIGILDEGARLGTAFGRFKETYFESDYMGYKWSIKKGAKEKIENLIGDLVIRLDAKDYLELPEIQEIDVGVVLSKQEKDLYTKFAKDMILEFGDKELTALSAVTLHGKLSQLANGMVYGENGEVIHFHSKKIEALKDLVEEISSPVLIIYKFTHERESILSVLPDAVVFNQGDSKKHVEDWNAGKIDYLLLHPQSGGHGLNLQDGGSHIIWFGPTSSLEQYLQTNKRLHRSGQNNRVLVHRLLSLGTIDEKIAEALKHKDDQQNRFLDSMKAFVSSLVKTL